MYILNAHFLRLMSGTLQRFDAPSSDFACRFQHHIIKLLGRMSVMIMSGRNYRSVASMARRFLSTPTGPEGETSKPDCNVI